MKKNLSTIISESIPPYQGLKDMWNDTSEALKTTKGKKDWFKFGAALAACAPIYTLAHEGMHLLTAKAFGADNFQIGVTPMFGGEFLSKFFSFIRADEEFLNGFYGITSARYPSDWSAWQDITVTYAPYVLTIAGVYLLHQGIKKKSPVLKALGIASTINLLAALRDVNACDYGRITGHFINTDSDFMTGIKFLANTSIALTTYYVSNKISRGVEYLKGLVRR